MALDIANLRTFVESFAVAVRAGLITPCLQDENMVREKFGFEKAPKEVEADWKLSEGVRKPNTIKQAPEEVANEAAALDGAT